MSDFNELVAHIQEDAKKFASNKDEDSREGIIANAYRLIEELQTPTEFIERTRWAEPARNGALIAALESGFFDQLAEKKDGMTATELAQEKNMDPEFVLRLMRHLAATGVVREVAAKTFANSKLSEQLRTPAKKGACMFLHYSQEPMLRNIAVWAKEMGYKNPVHGDPNGPYQITHNTKYGPYDWLMNERPNLGKHFNAFMTEKSDTTQTWMDPKVFPVQERLIAGANPDTPLLVDVGGGWGTDMERFGKLFPDAKGRLVVEDQEAVLKQIPAGFLSDRVETVVQNFFEPQKLIGARAYYMHNIMHNWNDIECAKILTQLKAAMKEGYSRILIFDIIMPPTKANWRVTSLDAIMYSFGGLQRTEEQWHALLSKVGLKIEKIWEASAGEEALIEVVLA